MMTVKTKKRICGSLAVLALLFNLGVIGGMERDTISLTTGVILSFISLVVFAAAAYKGGYLK